MNMVLGGSIKFTVCALLCFPVLVSTSHEGYHKKDTQPSRKAIPIPSVFESKNSKHKISITFSPRSIAFQSCCNVYYYTDKVIHVTPEVELLIKTADVRTASNPEVTIEKIDDDDDDDGKYMTLMMVNHYMHTITDKQVYVNWMVVNIVNEDLATGITLKEYEGPAPSIVKSDTYHFLLYQHTEPVDIFTSGKLTTPEHSRYRLELDQVFKNRESHLTATAKMKVDIDEYARYRKVNEYRVQKKQYVMACTISLTGVLMQRQHILLTASRIFILKDVNFYSANKILYLIHCI